MKKLYFERAKENRGEIPTTFIYDKISDEVKTQIILEWSETNNSAIENWSKEIVNKLRKSLGRFKLDSVTRYNPNYINELNNFFLQSNNIDHSLTVIEEMLIFLNDNGYYSLVDRVNERMRFAGIGYKHDGNFIHRVEDEIFDEEITQKTLGILAKKIIIKLDHI